MGTVTYLEKARQGRRNALASLGTHKKQTDNVVSIFDYAFEAAAEREPVPASNVIAFRSTRRALPAPAEAQAEAPAQVVRIAA